MIAAEKIDFKELKDSVKELNETQLLAANIKVIGVGKEVLAKQFGEAIDAMSDEDAAKLPESVANYYNLLFNDEVAVEGEVKGEKAAEEKKPGKEPKGPKAAKEKAEKPAKEQKAKKEVERGVFGSTKGSGADTLDTLLAEGATIEDCMAKAGVLRTRVTSHIKFLKENRNVEFTEEKVGDAIKYTGKVKAATEKPAA